MPLEISVTKADKQTVKVLLSGSLDSQTAPDLERELAHRVSEETRALAIDMSDLAFISSAGLRIIFKNIKTLKRQGGKLSVSGMSPSIRKVFEIVKVMPDLTVFSDEGEMDEYLAAIQERYRDA
ncbi:MAG: STAS domain-containing protein [Marinobacter sp.]|uniref:STAS domain-containing protein n=1 Tax=Marinobacter sp. TaxID=50741 RepID=UPI00299E7E73|nr:STAS domain-containing protein [Marinobacter sp.]MDX1756608.1 STAS domain-containing protein [Marinobacter sp.]